MAIGESRHNIKRQHWCSYINFHCNEFIFRVDCIKTLNFLPVRFSRRYLMDERWDCRTNLRWMKNRNKWKISARFLKTSLDDKYLTQKRPENEKLQARKVWLTGVNCWSTYIDTQMKNVFFFKKRVEQKREKLLWNWRIKRKWRSFLFDAVAMLANTKQQQLAFRAIQKHILLVGVKKGRSKEM